VKALFDTNILIDYLNGVENARAELRRQAEPMISTVSRMEVMVGVTGEQEAKVRACAFPTSSEVALVLLFDGRCFVG
jgi:predicted nucleic acid-binding protein